METMIVNNNNYNKWQFRARVIAYFDVVLCVLGLIGITLLAALAAFGVVALNSSDEFNNRFSSSSSSSGRFGSSSSSSSGDDHEQANNKKEETAFALNVFMIIVAVVLVLAVMIVVIQFWAAIRLLHSTEQNRDPKEALRMASFWRNVTIVFLILGVVGEISRGHYFQGLVTLAIRAIFLWVACNWIEELKVVVVGQRLYQQQQQQQDQGLKL